MERPTVVHVNDAYDIYIGRANASRGLAKSIWANPFAIGKDGARDEVIEKYRNYLRGNADLRRRLPELSGKRLGCWCKPHHACHGDVLVEFFGYDLGEPILKVSVPEHDKLTALDGLDREILAFLEWLNQEGYEIGRWNDGCLDVAHDDNIDLVHEYFEIDKEKLHKERETMYQAIVKHRQAQGIGV